MRTKKLSLYASALVMLVMASACVDAPHYEKFYAFSDQEWPQTIKPKFVVEVKDTTKWYDIVITLRTTTDYAFSNFWLFLNTKTPTGLTQREPFQIRIADEQGRWMGNKTGTLVENHLVFRKRKFPEAGSYVFTLEQGITEKIIDEILDVGLTMNEHPN